MSNLKEEVHKVLKQDNKNRVVGIQGELHELDSISAKQWDFSLPTLVTHDSEFSKRELQTTSTASFSKKFYEKYPHLRELDWSNVLVAGGCVGSIIDGSRADDVDIFIYGLNREEATQKIIDIDATICYHFQKKIYDDEVKRAEKYPDRCKDPGPLEEYMKDFPRDELDLNYIRTSKFINIKRSYDGTNFQIIFRLYQTKSEILHGFDIGSSTVGFDGTNVWLTGLSRFSYEYGYNIIDTTRRSTSYEHRLRKYANRGFGIILPYFNVDLLDTHLTEMYGVASICEMPYFCFSYTRVRGGRIRVSQYHKRYTDVAHDYGDMKDDCEYAVYFTNIAKLLQQDYSGVIYTGDTLQSVLTNPSCLEWSKIEVFYDRHLTKISERTFPTSQVEKYITVASPEHVFAHRNDKEELASIFQRQLEETRKYHTALLEHTTDIPWITENPGTQLTGSFNPIIENPEEWYGKYYSECV